MDALKDQMLTAGVDVGSAVVKVAIVETDDAGAERLVAGRAERIRRRDAIPVARELYDELLKEAGVSAADVTYVATTGEGETIPFRTGHFYGMTTHSRGGLFLEPEARAIIDMGALHTRAVAMDGRGKVLGYRMTSQCASGSGQFLENIARYLGVSLEEVGALSLQADAPETCSSICAVLAETDVINMVSRGISLPNILKGIHASMAGRAVKLVMSLGVAGPVLITGGLAADQGLVAAMRESAVGQKMTVDVRSHPQSILCGALGAALWGGYRARKLRDREPVAS
ncbi:MAG: benzoyl-CoA reductase subunit D [Acidobacteria bacterium]|nr:benzoyl-CoA reductase subunit D [Acidobacteriota bacterium]MBP8275078.1 benzoyl-CoA reductase subunit D [Acidobacteriota bacterium]